MPHVTAETLFERYLWPLYPEDARRDLELARTVDANPAGNPSVSAHLDEAARVFASMAPGLFGKDDPRLDFTDASVHRLSGAITPARRDLWASRGAPGTAENELFNVIVHGAAYLGACVTREHAGVWSVRRPLWESVVSFESRAGRGDLAVLQWLVKSLADPPPDAPVTTLADRYRTHVEIPGLDPEAIPKLISTGERTSAPMSPRSKTSGSTSPRLSASRRCGSGGSILPWSATVACSSCLDRATGARIFSG
jgi:hypothetical protein